MWRLPDYLRRGVAGAGRRLIAIARRREESCAATIGGPPNPGRRCAADRSRAPVTPRALTAARSTRSACKDCGITFPWPACCWETSGETRALGRARRRPAYDLQPDAADEETRRRDASLRDDDSRSACARRRARYARATPAQRGSRGSDRLL